MNIEQAALAAFIVRINRAYTGDPKNHRDWPAYLAGYLAGNHVEDVRHMVGVPDATLINEGTKATGVQPSASDGWKLVPVEPTPEMIKAADDGDREYSQRSFGQSWPIFQQSGYDHWVAMLKAAPTPPADSPDIITHFGAIHEPADGQAQQDADKVDAQPVACYYYSYDWYAKGTGPYPDARVGDIYDGVSLTWRRNKPTAPAVTKTDPAMAGDDLAQHFQGMSDQAYIRYIDQLKQNVCRGVEYKLENNKFGVTELAAHNKACEFLGRHRAFSEAAKLLKRVQPANPTLPPFPTMLRKMWSGREVQDWIDSHLKPVSGGEE